MGSTSKGFEPRAYTCIRRTRPPLIQGKLHPSDGARYAIRVDEITKELKEEYPTLYAEGIDTIDTLWTALMEHGTEIWVDELDPAVRDTKVKLAKRGLGSVMRSFRIAFREEAEQNLIWEDQADWKQHLGRYIDMIRRGRSALLGEPLTSVRLGWRLQIVQSQKRTCWPKFPHPLIRYVRYIHPYLGHGRAASLAKLDKWRGHLAVIAKRKAAPKRAPLTIEFQPEPGSPVFMARENQMEEREIERIISSSVRLESVSATKETKTPAATPFERPSSGQNGLIGKGHMMTVIDPETKGPIMDIRWSWGQSWQ